MKMSTWRLIWAATLAGTVLLAPTSAEAEESANEAVQDQKRVMTPREAFLAGADYVVVGRPVRAAQDPRAAAESIQQTIAELF